MNFVGRCPRELSKTRARLLRSERVFVLSGVQGTLHTGIQEGEEDRELFTDVPRRPPLGVEGTGSKIPHRTGGFRRNTLVRLLGGPPETGLNDRGNRRRGQDGTEG